MAYWGIAMSRFRHLWGKPSLEDVRVGLAALEKATAVGTESEREHGYINALEHLYEDADKVDHLTRVKAYEGAMEELHRVVREEKISIAIVAVPVTHTQEVIDQLVACGVRAILNYAPITPYVREGVRIRNIDPVLSLQSMTYYINDD